jgi:glutamate/tyrosine decarboxylase-like PLP-dependent enzyme
LKGESRLNHVLNLLLEYSRMDADPWSGRMFTHTYDHGIREIHTLTWKAYELYRDKTMLDFTVYPSIILIEKELEGFYAQMFHLPPNGSATYTYGGTESIIVATLAARESWRQKGGTGKGKIVMPATGHPAFAKAAFLLDLDIVRVPVREDSMEVEPGVIEEHIDSNTVMVVASAVNYPFGSLDPVKGISEVLPEEVWFHVDSCIGGPILAFAREAGEDFDDFDFKVEKVRSLSVDMHKYGYSPKGASLALFRDKEDRKPTIFVDASWPGYPLVNEAILSTRSAAPLAAAWAVARYLGFEGFRKLAVRTVRARRKIQAGLESLGFQVLGRPRAGIISFTSSEVDLLELASRLHRAGWIVQVQPGSRPLGFPMSLHLTVSPIHYNVVDEFLSAVEEALRGVPSPDLYAEKLLAEKGFDGLMELLESVGSTGLSGESLRLVDELIHILDPQLVEELIRTAILELFKPARVEW